MKSERMHAHPLTHSPTGMPDTELPRTLQGYLGCDWTSLTPPGGGCGFADAESGSQSGGAGAYKPSLKWKSTGPGHILLDRDVSFRGAAVKAGI